LALLYPLVPVRIGYTKSPFNGKEPGCPYRAFPGGLGWVLLACVGIINLLPAGYHFGGRVQIQNAGLFISILE